MAAGSIVVDLLMRTGSFETDTKRASASLKQLEKEARKVGVAIGAALSVVGVAVVGLVTHSINAADAMSKLAQQTGTTTEELSGLAYAAGLAGVNQDSLGTALVKLSKNMSDTASGTGEAVDAFAALGITVTTADGQLKSSSQVIAEVADKFSRMKDSTEKTALAGKIFGQAMGPQLVPLLNAGSAGIKELTDEARAMGVVMSSEAARSAEVFNDNLSRVRSAAEGLGNTITAQLLPSLVSMSSELVEIAKSQEVVNASTSVMQGVIDGIRVVFQTVAVVGSDVAFVFRAMGREIGALAAQAAALARLDIKGFTAISDAVKEDGVRARAELDAFQRKVLGIGISRPDDQSEAEARRLGLIGPAVVLSNAPVIKKTTPLGKTAGGSKDSISERTSELDRYALSLVDTIAKEQQLTELQRAQALISESGGQGFSEFKRQYVLSLAEQIDATKRLKDETQALLTIDEAIEAEETARADARAQNLKRLLDATPTAALERTRADMVLLTEAFEKNDITPTQYFEAIDARLDTTSDKLKESKSLVDELGLSFKSAFEDAVVGGKNASEVLRGIGQDILRIGIRKAITEPAGNFITSAIGKLFSFDGGGFTGFGPRSGGLDGKGGKMALVHPNETILDHTKGQGVGASGGDSFYFTVGDVATVSMVQKAIAASQRQAAAALGRSQNYGGAFQ